MKNNKGFTLIEMLIVLAVISILLILFIPNLASKSENINEQGCEALLTMVENQLIAYELDEGSKPDNLSALEGEYVASLTCDNGNRIIVYNNSKDGLEIVDNNAS
ncbi:competence type IV pilus major pilin ComGC [Gracilibacillus thailandensis]|uniref:ComG operon protein 3 n=1 Tax=Gracilibacillus thailandensis TaxID=563735 RepID=A0A6N7R3C5_9BACI|nr:competence type IV pilus major pilin ComGC [Gracilibacillus thailandensis]MRI67296.1 prepilin-type N-terminal cleavage/methylation domain-containing protein [Gracilibacillus thailandensis]